MKKIFVTGGSSGIGKACVDLLSNDYQITAPTRQQLNLSNFEQIDQLDLGEYDIVINCAGINPGTYLGFLDNSYTNQNSQIDLNFTAPLLLAKQYIKTRTHGHFIYISSISIDNPYTYNIVNASAKAALRFSMDVIKQDFNNFFFTEVCPGKTKTNMLYQNYQGTKTHSEVESEYVKSKYLLPTAVAESVLFAITNNISTVKLSP
jgi:NADP-dependent 3-hydroxy acid dehydrogenase YdfG